MLAGANVPCQHMAWHTVAVPVGGAAIFTAGAVIEALLGKKDIAQELAKKAVEAVKVAAALLESTSPTPSTPSASSSSASACVHSSVS